MRRLKARLLVLGGILLLAFAIWEFRAPLAQWGVNRIVELLQDVGGIRAYMEAHRTGYLTEREARIDVRGKVRAAGAAGLGDIRRAANDYIWKDAFPSSRLPDEIRDVTSLRDEHALGPVSRIRSLSVRMAHGVEVRALFLETSAASRDCLIVYHQDHNAILLGERDWFRRFLEAGCDVVSVPLPLTTELSPAPVRTKVGGEDVLLRDHNDFARLESADFSPIRFFLEPTIAAVNLGLSEKAYERIAATGLSGGGWVATVIAALDPRFTHAYPVAGMVPLYLQRPGSRNRGDWEHNSSGLYDVVNYFELYLLGVLESRRRAVHIYNRRDNCCYNGVLTAAFSAQVEGIAKRWSLGAIRFHIDDSAKVHLISDAALNMILDDFLG